jgi:hypothetical protein
MQINDSAFIENVMMYSDGLGSDSAKTIKSTIIIMC